MRILVTNPTAILSDTIAMYPDYRQYVGFMNTPRYFGNFERYKNYDPTMPVAVDNSAFVNFDEGKYRRLIAKINIDIEWITVQDVWCDARTTLFLFDWWEYELRKLPLALVGQDNMEDYILPWHKFECLFIGGSDEWRLSRSMLDLAREAKRRGKWIHMGRVNSDKRMRYAYENGFDSIDGSGFTAFGKLHLANALHFMGGLHRQESLFR